ncbi:MAG: sodium:proton antiporter [Candidatus Omnitrophica bacterium]|nr:sodium:proton antiporter [Candidatus Omnitrophota bacterium]MDD5653141.1 sodium:proton antiporter [Candidatus Omnitrophota bacterium]
MSLYFLCFMLFCVGLYCLVRKRNIIKIVIGLGIIEYSLNLFFILLGYRTQGRAPILISEQELINTVDPLPQAMVLTTIVVGLAVMVTVVSLALRVYEKYGTFDITKIRRLKG